jgi:hypothetical protein
VYSGLPKSLGQFLTLGLDVVNAVVQDSSNARKAHSCHNQTQYKSYDQFHDVFTFFEEAVFLNSRVT